VKQVHDETKAGPEGFVFHIRKIIQNDRKFMFEI